MSQYDRAYWASRRLIARGMHPGPTAVNALLGKRGNNLNGVMTNARRNAMEDADFWYDGARYHAPGGPPREDGFVDRKNRFYFGMDLSQRIEQVHDPAHCVGHPCVVHRPSDHSMRGHPLHWREHTPFVDIKPSHFERICEHGFGHPDPDDLAFHIRNGDRFMAVHGCDGCCRTSHDHQDRRKT